MALRFRKSVKLAPGIRMNFSRGGLSWSLGPRGASVGIGKRGTYLNAGLPGTGLSFRQRLDAGGSASGRSSVSRDEQASIGVTVGVEDDGTLTFRDSLGNALSSELVAATKRQQGDALKGLMQQKCDEINAQIEALGTLHLHSPRPTDRPSYRPIPFEAPLPNQPTPKRPSWLRRLFGGAAEVEQENARAEAAYREASDRWTREKEAHQAAEQTRKHLLSQAAGGNIHAMEVFLETALADIVWPRETLVSFELQEGGVRLVFDVDLPEIEDMPTKTAVVPQRGYKLSVKDLGATKLLQLYAGHVHSITFRLIAEAFALLPTVEVVVLSAYTQRVDPRTGRDVDQYLLSVRVQRSQWGFINFGALESIDVIEALDRFDLRRAMTKAGAFKAIEPF